jgi:hypothetical protein
MLQQVVYRMPLGFKGLREISRRGLSYPLGLHLERLFYVSTSVKLPNYVSANVSRNFIYIYRQYRAVTKYTWVHHMQWARIKKPWYVNRGVGVLVVIKQQCAVYRAGPRRMCIRGQFNNLASFQIGFFKLFLPTIGLANIFEGACPNWG